MSGLDALTTPQQELIGALLEHRTIAAAARAVGVQRTNYYRWLDEDPLFRSEVQAARRRFAEEGLELLVGGMSKCVARILEALDSKDQNVRLRAGIEGCKLALELRRTVEVEDRIRELWERVDLLKLGAPR